MIEFFMPFILIACHFVVVTAASFTTPKLALKKVVLIEQDRDN